MHDRTKSSRLLLAALTCVLVVGLVWGIAGALGASSSPSPAGDKVVLKIGWVNEPDNLNPFIGYESSAFEIWSLNYDQLVQKDAASFGPGPNPDPEANALATSWDQSTDGKVWTFHIREGVKWQDGQPLTAEDVAWTYNFIKDNGLYAFTVATQGIKKAEAIDDVTVKITCSTPKADMLSLWIPILPKHIWEKAPLGNIETNYNNKPPIVGSGPFQCTEFVKGQYAKMVKNPTYWGPAPAVDEIYFRVYTNADTMSSDLQTGTIDAAWGIPQGQFDKVAGTDGIEAIKYNFFNWDYLNFNCLEPSKGYAAGWTKSYGNPVLTDPKFRQALMFAVDHQKLVDVAWGGNAAPGTTILPPDTWTDPDWHWQPSGDQMYTFDLAKATAAMDAAGYKTVDGKLLDKQGKQISLRLFTPSDSIEAGSEGKLIAGWFGSLGIDITLEAMDSGTMSSKIWNYEDDGSTFAPDFDMYIWDWDGYADPGQTLECYSAEQIGGWNEPAWENDEFNKLLGEQAAAMDPTERQQLIGQMQQIMYDDNPQMVLTYPNYLEAYNTDKWTGWTRVLDGKGPAFYTAGNIDTYLNLKPQASTKSSGSNSALIAGIAVAVVVIVLIIVFVSRRGKKTQVEEV
jgi:peptide/nickel transport system substrate-binding protein